MVEVIILVYCFLKFLSARFRIFQNVHQLYTDGDVTFLSQQSHTVVLPGVKGLKISVIYGAQCIAVSVQGTHSLLQRRALVLLINQEKNSKQTNTFSSQKNRTSVSFFS